MTNLPSTDARASGNPFSFSIQRELPTLVGGLVQHALVSASTQVRVLAVIDETGSSTVGDIVGEFPDHPDPVGAVMVMVELKLLLLEVRGVVDEATIVRRADLEPDPSDKVEGTPFPSGSPSGSSISHQASVPGGLERLDPPFSASVIVGG